ncbi:hypothetical protein [Neorhodopirellula lusitana]|uniref:hypothetical protein n=1 Tax=Neorhodopirellula lusitana TaxID=445327 RepID=UPI0024B7503E|nr:hypothetical protein [Neorhodopirellula lusitana]
MKTISRTAVALLLTSLVVPSTFAPSVASADNPGWSPVVIARGDYRTEIKSLPIERRPNRPFHFYGNTVRRRQSRSVYTAPRSIAPVYSAPSVFGGSVWRQR